MKHLQLQPLDRRKVCRFHCKSIPSEVDVYVLSLTYLYTCTPVHLNTCTPVHLPVYKDCDEWQVSKCHKNDPFNGLTDDAYIHDEESPHINVGSDLETRIHTYPLHSWADHFPTRRFWIDKGWYKIVVTNGPKNSHRGK